MAEVWFIELAKGTGRFFLNPIGYWTLILVILLGLRRIDRERKIFGFKIFDVFSEWKKTWPISVAFGLIISVIMLAAGVVLSYETIFLLALITILLSLTMSTNMLSPSYTIGTVFILLLALPFIIESQTILSAELFETPNFAGLSLLLALLLMAEGSLLKRISRHQSFPNMQLGQRGIWIGSHQLKKISLIPFFILVPSGPITSFAPFWPYFTVYGESYSLVLVPFLLGISHVVKGSLPEKAAVRIAGSVHILSLTVLFLAIGSIYIGWLSLIAILIGIIGREYINFSHRLRDKERTPFFNQNEHGLKVLGVIPNTPADRLGILAGETIVKVNGRKINTMDELYYALQGTGAFFKLAINGDNGEVRFVQSALYEEDHHELGIITTQNPDRGSLEIANN